VITAMIDPNPRVAGKGLQQLNTAGINAEFGLLENEARALNPGFIKRMTEGLPYVRCKLAVSADGKTALMNGASQWITGAQARMDGQHLRAQSCAIMTGIGTVLADDPLLTVRDVDTLSRHPLRVIIDRQLRTPPTAKLFSEPGPVVIYTASQHTERQLTLSAKGAAIVVIEDDNFLRDCLVHLSKTNEINEVLLEAGPGLSGSMIKAGLVDELIVYQAAVILGDKAMPMLVMPEITELGHAISMTLTDMRNIGSDIRLSYILNRT